MRHRSCERRGFSAISNTWYCGKFIYNDAGLDYFFTSEGRALNTISGTPRYRYEYNYKDQTGNVVMSFSDLNNDGAIATTEVLQQSVYYPFGLDFTLSPPASQIGAINPYKYSGKELQNDFNLNLYDFGARMFDPQIGRWNGVDPLAISRKEWSVYNYCRNNPIIHIDPNGMVDGDYYDKDGKYLGSDGKTDDKVYVADKKEEKDGNVNFVNAKELPLTHTQFQKLSGLAAKEEGKKTAIFAVANCQANRLQAKLKKGSTFDKAFNSFNNSNAKTDPENGLHGYMLKNRPRYKAYWDASLEERNKDNRFVYGQAAVINAWSDDGVDETNGATGWDGIDANLPEWPAYRLRREAGFIWDPSAKIEPGAKMTPQNMPNVLNCKDSYYYIITYAANGSIYWKENPNWIKCEN